MRSLKPRGRRPRVLVLSLALAAAVLPAATAAAALPPYYQRLNELQAILGNGEVESILIGHGPIDAIERVADDVYRVSAGTCDLEVRIVNDTSVEREPGWVGPRQFLVEVGDVVCE